MKYKLCPYKKYIYFKTIKDSRFLLITLVALIVFNKFWNNDIDRRIINSIVFFNFVILLDAYNSSLKETLKSINEVYPVFHISRRKILNKFFLQKESANEIDVKYFEDILIIDDVFDEEVFFDKNRNFIVLSRTNYEVEVVDLNSPFGGLNSAYDFLHKLRIEMRENNL